jgi:hypothetical protein
LVLQEPNFSFVIIFFIMLCKDFILIYTRLIVDSTTKVIKQASTTLRSFIGWSSLFRTE